MLAGLVLLALVVSAALTPRWGRPGAVVLSAVSVLWLLVNGPMEGRILWVLSPAHGLSSGDLAGLAGLALAAWGLVRSRSTGRR